MVARIYIAIPCYNRRKVVEQCLPTIADSKASADYLDVWNDGSTEYGADWLGQWADHVVSTNHQRGIEMQRKAHFTQFMTPAFQSFTHIYLTDSDAIHDPNWRSEGLGLQLERGGAPVCLYNTEAHARMKGNTLEDDPKSNVIWRYYAPGISYLLTRAHVEAIAKFGILNLSHWDWDVPRILGHRFAVSRVSYVDHIGHGGLHHDGSAGYDGGDRAINPTPRLRDMRKLAIEEIESK